VCPVVVEMSALDRSPTRLGSRIAVVAAVVAVLVGGPYSWLALATGTTGLVLVLFGVGAGSHAAVTTGTASLFVGVIAAGVAGAPVPWILGGGVAAVVAWDSGGTAIDLGHQLGRGAETTRLELVHAGATGAVGSLTAATAWSVYRLLTGTYSLTVPALLIVAAVCIAVALASHRE